MSILERSIENMKVLEKIVETKIGARLAHVRIVLRMLDPEHNQIENGTQPCQFLFPTNSKSNHIVFQPQVHEWDDSLHTFRIRYNTIMVGDAALIFENGDVIGCFSIRPIELKGNELKGKNQIELNVVPMYDNAPDITITIKFDDKGRINHLQMSDINLDIHPFLKAFIVRKIMYEYETVNIKNALELMNKLEYDRIKAHEKILMNKLEYNQIIAHEKI